MNTANDVKLRSIWTKNGCSPKTKYNVINYGPDTVVFVSNRTGTHSIWAMANFLSKFTKEF